MTFLQYWIHFLFAPLVFGAGELCGLPLLFRWHHYFVFVCKNTVITSKITYIGAWLGPSTSWPWGEEKLTCYPSHPKSQSYWTELVRYHVFSAVSIRYKSHRGGWSGGPPHLIMLWYYSTSHYTFPYCPQTDKKRSTTIISRVSATVRVLRH